MTERFTNWQGFGRAHFDVAGCACFVTEPVVPLPGRPWVWRASFPDFHAEIDLELLRVGWHVGYIETGEMLGCDAALDLWDAFYQRCVQERGLAPRPALEAVSRGGLYAYRWAARHPAQVAAIYADTPVMDLKSWPGGKGKGVGAPDVWKIALARYGFASEADALAFRGNPLDLLPLLARAKIPLRHVISLDDRVVPPEENTREAARRLRRLGRTMELVTVEHGIPESQGHHFPLPAVFASAQFVQRHAWGPPRPGRESFALRGGLGRSLARFEVGGAVRVAFLGGSITQSGGWRDEVERWLTMRFPQATFSFVRAGVASLGSVPHAFRLERDVLWAGPIDLCFVEAAVNDPTNLTAPARMHRAMEGIVRYLRRENPQGDIVHLHFAMPEHLADYRAGKVPEAIRVHEKVAARYANPSLNLAREVADRIAAGQFTWEGDFRDLHPSPFGHQLYAASIARLLDRADAARGRSQGPHALPSPLDPACYDRGTLVGPSAAGALSGFTLDPAWRPTDAKETRPGYVNVPALVATSAGASLELPFEGNAIGLMIVAGPDAGVVECAIDGRVYAPVDAFTPWSAGLHLPWALVLADALSAGPHTLHLRLGDAHHPRSVGNALRIVNFLVNRTRAEPV